MGRGAHFQPDLRFARICGVNADLARLAAPLFVLLWSTGFIGAKLGLPHAEPLTFLSLRFVLAGVALAIWSLVAGSPWPRRAQLGHLALVGVLLHGVYLGGVFCAISLGTEAGVAALIVSLQPVLTAVLARRFLGERMSAVQWLGLVLGLLGVVLVVWDKLNAGIGDLRGAGLCGLAVIGISVASLYQKKFCSDVPMRAGSAVQFAAALLFLLPLALLLETNRIEWTGAFIFALGWLVIVLSLGAVGLLLVLLRRDAAGQVASLFFLTPPVTALLSWALFGETLSALAIFGMAVAVSGVALVVRNPQIGQRAGNR